MNTNQNFQTPKNKKQIQSFLGFINFYRKYIRDLSKYTAKLSQLTKSNTEWEWGVEQQQAFDIIKENFLVDIIIEYPDFTREFYLSTDASKTHIGAELYQIDENGRHRTFGFTSRKLKDIEQRYYTIELELLAVVFGCMKYRNYILGFPVNILIDHKALSFLNQCPLLNAHLMRWSIKLQEFSLKITHISGKENVGADTLTRYPQSPGDSEKTLGTIIYLNQVIKNQYSPQLLQQFKQIIRLQSQDERRNIIRNKVTSQPNTRYQVHHELLFFIDKKGKPKVIVPNVMVKRLVNVTHELFGHFGISKVYDILKREYQIHQMYNTIIQIIKKCDICQRSKVSNQNSRGPLIANIPEGPREKILLDLMDPLPRGQLGNHDIFSKHIQLYVLRRATADNILRKLQNQYLPKHGPVKCILTDNGTQFHSKKWKTQLQLWNIHHTVTTTNHLEGNSVERANREIGRILRTYCHHKHSSWVNYLPKI